ncbi:unnamed protein product [Haemonchus placei]|uniref:Secreted protein n=1 Tax=Haemonchus placei TaxID=6290 RepID=A0A0N4W7C7_HAEPC|nr:unnamed protein product [Haemonchus placei]
MPSARQTALRVICSPAFLLRPLSAWFHSEALHCVHHLRNHTASLSEGSNEQRLDLVSTQISPVQSRPALPKRAHFTYPPVQPLYRLHTQASSGRAASSPKAERCVREFLLKCSEQTPEVPSYWITANYRFRSSIPHFHRIS